MDLIAMSLLDYLAIIEVDNLKVVTKTCLETCMVIAKWKKLDEDFTKINSVTS